MSIIDRKSRRAARKDKEMRKGDQRKWHGGSMARSVNHRWTMRFTVEGNGTECQSSIESRRASQENSAIRHGYRWSGHRVSHAEEKSGRAASQYSESCHGDRAARKSGEMPESGRCWCECGGTGKEDEDGSILGRLCRGRCEGTGPAEVALPQSIGEWYIGRAGTVCHMLIERRVELRGRARRVATDTGGVVSLCHADRKSH
jgi:hypothetical protein